MDAGNGLNQLLESLPEWQKSWYLAASEDDRFYIWTYKRRMKSQALEVYACYEHMKELIEALDRAIRLQKLREAKREYHRKRR